MKINILVIILLCFQIVEIHCATILVMAALCVGSEHNFYIPIIEGLVKNGHEVTYVTSKRSTRLPATVTQIEPVLPTEVFGDINAFEMKENNEDSSFLFFDMEYFASFCDKVYQNQEFKEKVMNQKFDLVLSNALMHECFYPLAYKNNASLILLSSFPPENYLVNSMGTYFPHSFIPYPTLPLTDIMTFHERVYNFLADVSVSVLNEFSYTQTFERRYRENLAGGENYPGLKEIRKNVSLFIINSNFLTNFLRPLLPDVIEAGGLHCQPAKLPLAPDLEKFVSEAPEGFIYFSLGSMNKGNQLPEKTRNVFINVFSKLKQRVLWKWESDEDLPGRPPNVMVSKWFSQRDILGHPNIRFFISHGGLFSTQETIYNGVPVIGLPIYFDQYPNVKQAVKNGYALKLDIYNLKEEDLELAVHQMLTNSSYQERATLLSQVFRDQPETPLDRAIFWIEYIIRHKGAPHLRSAARDLSWFQYHSLDVMLFIALTILTIFTLLIAILRFILMRCFSSKKMDIERKRK